MEIFGKAAPLLTTTREGFIGVFQTLAEGIDQSFLLDKERPPIIGIVGGYDSGKSLAVETMIKTLAGQDTASTLAKEKDHMFLEQDPGDALSGVSGIFNLAGGHAIRQVFLNCALDDVNLRSPKKLLLEAPKMDTSNIKGGVIFVAGKITPHHEQEDRLWISIGINKFSLTYPGDTKWRRTTTISVNNPDLWDHPSFVKTREALSAVHLIPAHL